MVLKVREICLYTDDMFAGTAYFYSVPWQPLRSRSVFSLSFGSLNPGPAPGVKLTFRIFIKILQGWRPTDNLCLASVAPRIKPVPDTLHLQACRLFFYSHLVLQLLSAGRAPDEPEELLGDAAVENPLGGQQRERVVTQREPARYTTIIYQ